MACFRYDWAATGASHSSNYADERPLLIIVTIRFVQRPGAVRFGERDMQADAESAQRPPSAHEEEYTGFGELGRLMSEQGDSRR